MKKVMTSLALIAGLTAYAQVGINEEAPKATLDVTAKTTSGDALEGILIPRVTTQKAEDMGANNQIQESTLIYIKDDAAASTDTYTAEVDAKGFYYFADSKWNKVGGGSTSGASLQTITGRLKIVDAITPAKWAEEPKAFVLVQTSGAQIGLPDPADYLGKIISVNNQYNNSVGYSGTNQPKNITDLEAGKGHILMAGIDTTNSNQPTWFLIGGSY